MPDTIEELMEIVYNSKKVKVIGSAHSFNDIANTSGTIISLDQIDKTVSFNKTLNQATVNAGITYTDLAPILHQEGYALKNLASISDVTVIGACSTATHGSGKNNGNLATNISGIDIIKANGDFVHLSSNNKNSEFYGSVVSLGSLGVVTKVYLYLVPSYEMRQIVYKGLSLENFKNNFNDIIECGYSISFFTDWKKKIFDQVWIKEIVTNDRSIPIESDFFGATLSTKDLHPLKSHSAKTCTTQRGIPGPWYERLPHFRLNSSLIKNKELQSEYFVSIDNALDALFVIESLSDILAPLLKISEVRIICEDNFWLSPSYKQDCIGIHFTWHNKLSEINILLPILESNLFPFLVRPHWGKLFSMNSIQLKKLYKRMVDFQSLLFDFDPYRKFSNKFLKKFIYP